MVPSPHTSSGTSGCGGGPIHASEANNTDLPVYLVCVCGEKIPIDFRVQDTYICPKCLRKAVFTDTRGDRPHGLVYEK